MYLCYHHNDMDGKAAGNEVYKYLKNVKHIEPLSNMFIMRGYDDPFKESDYEGKEVYIVDLSMTETTIQNLFDICEKASKVTWIDHHKSSLEAIENKTISERLNKYENLTYAVNNDACGALLTYLYLNGYMGSLIENGKFKSEETPDMQIKYLDNLKVSVETNEDIISAPISMYMKLVDQWDRWVYGEYQEPVYFNFGCQMHNTSLFTYPNKQATAKTYNKNFWYVVERFDYTVKIIKEGEIGKKYFDTSSIKSCSSNGYECTIGGHTAFVLNTDEGNSMVFGNKIKKYDIVCAWRYNGRVGLYQYSLYSDKDDVDCAKIAQSYNPAGGGHKGASGFSSDKLLFKKQ